MRHRELPVPPHHQPEKVAEVWRVEYEARAADALAWARDHDVPPAAGDDVRIHLLLVDVQNTFCIPGFELYVGGRSGTGAVDDNRRLCDFLYRNLARITRIFPTLDTHRAAQIFHPQFLVDEKGEHPAPFTSVAPGDVESGRWRFNADLAPILGIDPSWGQIYLMHYVHHLHAAGKYDLTVWPYHAMLGGIGHALVPSVEEAVFFHGIARRTQPDFQVKGDLTLTENYSVLRPEVTAGPSGEALARGDMPLVDLLLDADALVVAGQAKSHCVAWTVADLLQGIRARDPGLAKKVYLLEDCTSPVVIPDVADFTGPADDAYRRFADAGMHRVLSIQPLDRWPGMPT